MAIPTTTEYREIAERMARVLHAEFGAGIVSVGRGAREDGRIAITHYVLVKPKTVAGTGATPVSPEDLIAARVKNLAHLYKHEGILPEDLERPIMVRGYPCKVVDIVPRRPQYPFTVQAPNGSKYKVGVSHILLARPSTAVASRPPPINTSANWKGPSVTAAAKDARQPSSPFGDEEAW